MNQVFLDPNQQYRFLRDGAWTKCNREYDTQRTKLYKAEMHLFSGDGFKNISECQKYVNKVLSSAWFKRRFNVDQLYVKYRNRYNGRAQAFTDYNMIILPPWGMCQLTIIHEIVHFLVRRPHAAHGRLFARVMLELVRHEMGKDSYLELKESYRKYNVKFTPKRSYCKWI